MKKGLFLLFTITSIGSYLFAGLLLAMSNTENDPGMALVLLMPLLAIGLVSGVVAYLMTRSKELALSKLLMGLHRFDLILMAIGAIGLIALA